MPAEKDDAHRFFQDRPQGSSSGPYRIMPSKESLQANPPDTSPKAEKDVEDSPLEEDDFEVLRRMVIEYKAHRIDFSSLPRRPKFKGGKVNSGIAINAEVKRRAVERAKADPDGTGGGNLSGLIELLLWTFLGCPDDVIDKGPGK